MYFYVRILELGYYAGALHLPYIDVGGFVLVRQDHKVLG